jgi:hypothetical protein
MRTLILILAVFVGLGINAAFSEQPLESRTEAVLGEQPVKKETCTEGAERVATMEDGDVNFYRVTSCIYYDGTDILARRDICYVTVGELHGKTVTMDCLQ